MGPDEGAVVVDIRQVAHVNFVGVEPGQPEPRSVVRGDRRVELPPAERVGHVDGLGQVGDLVLCDRQCEQRRRYAERVQVEASQLTRLCRYDQAPGQRVTLQLPTEQADIADVVPATTTVDPAYVDRVGQVGLLERRTDVLHPRRVPDRREREVGRADVVHVLGRRDQFEELDCAGRPAGDIASDLLQYSGSAFATAVPDGVCDLGPWGDPGTGSGRQAAQADQFGEVRQHPGRGGLDEEVVVELIHTVCHRREFVGEHLEQLLQWAAFVPTVTLAVESGKQVVELILLDDHLTPPPDR